MSIDRILTVVSLIIGLPAFFALFIGSAHQREGALCAIMVLLILGGSWWYKRQEDLPQFTTLELHKTLVVTATDGSAATYSRAEKMRANVNGISEWWNRNNQFDGSVSNILINGAQPDDTVTSMGSVTDVCKRFQPALDKGNEETITLSYDLRDAFKRSHESLVHNNSAKVQQIILTVELPRPCTNPVLRKTYNGDHGKRINGLAVSSNNRTLEATIRKPRMGASYHIEWDW